MFQIESVSCKPEGECLGVSSSLFSLFLRLDPIPGPCPLPGPGNGLGSLQEGGSSAWCPAAVAKGSSAAASAIAQQHLFS